METEKKPRARTRKPGEKREAGLQAGKPGMRCEAVRGRIQAAKIVKSLEDHVLKPRSKMSATRVAAAKILLAKIMPDQAATKLEVDSAPVQFVFNMAPKQE